MARGDPSGTPADGSYWLPSERHVFSSSAFYQPTQVLDSFDKATDITYYAPTTGSPYYLMPL